MPVDFRTFGGTARLNQWRVGIIGWPPWARSILFLLALPGIVLIALSFLALLVSILALLLLTVPAYRLLNAVFRDEPEQRAEDSPVHRRRVESTVVESATGVDET